MRRHEEREGTPGGRPHRDERDLDAIAGRVTTELLTRSHLMRPGEITGALARAARPLGVTAVRIYLADLQQRQLAALPAGDDREPDVLPIDSTLPGRAYQAMTIHSVPADDDGGYRVWIPLVDGTERIGVLGLTVADASESMLDRYRALAALTGIMVMAKASHSDTYARTQRDRRMALQAELVWAFLPPRTFASEHVLVSATLEPAYDAGGDAFDYALLGDHLHVSIFDALGHDLSAGLMASVSIASCRSTRRAGGSLPVIAARADDAIACAFGEDQFVTALLCDLDMVTGLFTWIPCGHPAPLLIRGQTFRELAGPPQPPLGLVGAFADQGKAPRAGGLCMERLEPRDRLLLYSDGVTEGRAPGGTPFGLQRLGDFVIGHSSARLPAPETMRRLNHAILDYQHGRLRDDATVVLIEWQPTRPGHDLTP
ncbi:MAG TPA: SpoIIE family protein phosphatase [Trebonia sp.]